MSWSKYKFITPELLKEVISEIPPEGNGTDGYTVKMWPDQYKLLHKEQVPTSRWHTTVQFKKSQRYGWFLDDYEVRVIFDNLS